MDEGGLAGIRYIDIGDMDRGRIPPDAGLSAVFGGRDDEGELPRPECELPCTTVSTEDRTIVSAPAVASWKIAPGWAIPCAPRRAILTA